MADDQVKYSDLIADDVVKGLELLNKALQDIKTTMAGVKEEAASLGVSLKNVSTATREQQQATAQNAASVDGLSKKVKQLTEEERMLESVRRQYKKLTDDQIARVDRLAVSLSRMNTADQSTVDHALKLIDTINIENKSYNELQATYNALMNAIKNMNTEQLRSSQIGKTMVATAKNIRETMNETQKSVGNYTLQVGKYKAAFDGLGFSFMQIVREAPSALNLNQFFLAISNNLPMFFDQIDRFKTEQKEIKQTLADLAAQGKQTSDEYIKIANQQTTVFKRLTTAVFSMQGAVLLFTMFMRFLPKIVDWVKKLFTGFKDLSAQLELTGKKFRAIIDAQKNMANVSAELDIVYRRLKNVDQGTQEWVDGISTVNKLTGQHINALDTTIDKVGEVIEQYKKMQKAIEINRIVASKLGDAEVRSQLYYNLMYGPDEYRDKRYDKDFVNRTIQGFVTDEQMNQINDYLDKAHSQLADEREKARKTLDDLYYKYITIPGREQRMWENMYQIVDAGDGKNGPTKTSKEDVFDFSPEDVNDQYWKAEKARIGLMEDGLKKELELQKLAHAEALEQNDVYYADREEQLMNNLMGELKLLADGNDKVATEMYDAIVRNDTEAVAQMGSGAQALAQQYWRDIEKGERQHNIIEQGLIVENERKVKALRMANFKARKDEWEKNAKDNAKTELKAAVDGWAEYKAKLIEEGKTRKQIVEAEVAAEIARLNLMLKLNRDVNGEKMSDEQRQKVEEWINLLKQLQAAGNFRGIKLGSIFGKGASGLGGEKNKSGNYSNIMDVLFPDMSKDQQSALNSVFDQAKEALNSWMDARKAAADQAKELADDEVSAAEQALNREIELRNQGYANDVALRERELADAKKAQKKALEMQQKAKVEELAINTAMEASSMAVAIANLFKQFPLYVAIPLTGVLLGAWGAARASAFSQIRSKKFREGGVMLLEGGSHESGHDVNLGIGPDGSNLRAEGGEYFAVINKRNSRRYGREIPGIVNALNSGVFEDRYIKTSDAAGLVGAVGAMSAATESGRGVDLSAVEKGVQELVKQGDEKWSSEGNYRVMRYKNLVRRVKIG